MLRDYQIQAINSIQNQFNEYNNLLCIMPTGTGKTFMFSHVIKSFYDNGQDILCIAHRDELLNQIIQSIYTTTNYYPGKEKADQKCNNDTRIVVASVQSLTPKRLENYKKNKFSLIVIDEAHRTIAKSYIRVLEYFNNYKLLGVTATPDRNDNKSLGKIYENVAYQYSLVDAIKQGFLANIVGYAMDDFDIDLSELRTVTNKDFKEEDVERIIVKYILPLSESIAKETKDLKTIIFLPSVKSSNLLSQALNQLGLKSVSLNGETDSSIRRKELSLFATGKITHLVNCGLFTEGYDEPSIQSVVIARPTLSRSLFAQMVGRGTRLHESKLKDEKGNQYVKLLQCSYINMNHKLVSPIELFTSKGIEEKTREIAESKIKGKDDNYLDIVEKAKEYRFSIDRIRKDVKIKVNGFIKYDPFVLLDSVGIDLSGELEVTYKGYKLVGKATDEQKALLDRHKINYPINLTKSQASMIIDQIKNNGWRVENIINGIVFNGQNQN
jgi:superfamily II DNA or RNA helicase